MVFPLNLSLHFDQKLLNNHSNMNPTRTQYQKYQSEGHCNSVNALPFASGTVYRMIALNRKTSVGIWLSWYRHERLMVQWAPRIARAARHTGAPSG